MVNFSKEQLDILKNETNKFHEFLKLSSEWVNRNVSLEEKYDLLNTIHETKSDIYTIHESIETKPVFALFGVSQVGKSYLVKNLLSVDGQKLEIEIPGEQTLDFLSDINPRGGGTESTGVVSRFSIESSFIDSEYPVGIKLLDVKDIILIICDSFFSDILKLDYYPSVDDFNQHANRIEEESKNLKSTQAVFTEDDVFFMKKYFEIYLERSSPNASIISKSKFWITISQNISRFDKSHWKKIFQILWANDDKFGVLFDTLLDGLNSLSFERKVYATKSAILRDQGKILDVVRVNGIFKAKEPTNIQLPNKNVISIDLHILSALTSEITMTVSKKVAEQKEFLSHTDLLDFPGARSRKPFEQNSLKDENIPDLLLRGKISYLFNKYSANYEINNLLFCLKNTQNEVREIPILINDWIKRNVGENDISRETRIGRNGVSPLFVVMTFYNETIKFNPNADDGDLSEKWDRRFLRLFKDETVTRTNDWDEKWTKSQPKFQNFYLLRDFQFSQDIFDGIDGKETNIRPEKLEYYKRLKDSFLNFSFVKDHFKDPIEAWESSTSVNMDGSERIIRDLYPAANNAIKTKNYISNLSDFQVEMLNKLAQYHVSDNIHSERKRAQEQGGAIRDQLLNLFSANGNNSKFGEFISKYHLTNTEVYNFIHANYLPAGENHNPTRETVIVRTYGLDINAGIQENKIILKDKLLKNTTQEVDEWLEENEIDLENVLKNVYITAASILVDGIIDIWHTKMNLENFQTYTSSGLDLATISVLNENLKQTFDLFKVRNELIYVFEKKTRLLRVSIDTSEYLASIITSYINDFSSNFGFNFMTEERQNLVLQLAKEYNIDLELLHIEHKEISQEEIADLFDESDSQNARIVTYPVVDHYKAFITKVQLILLSNCGFRNYNIEENQNLKSLISEIESLKF